MQNPNEDAIHLRLMNFIRPDDDSLNRSDMVIEKPQHGTLILGNTGSGKNTLLGKLLQKHIQKGDTLFIYDMQSPDLFTAVEALVAQNELVYLRRYGRLPEIKRISLLDSKRSERCNPMAAHLIPDLTIARQLARTLYGNLKPGKTWLSGDMDQATVELLTACIWFFKRRESEVESEAGSCSLPHLIELLSQPTDQLLNVLQSEAEINQLIPFQGNSEYVEAIHLGLRLAMSRLKSPELYWAMTGSSISLAVNDPQHPLIVFLEGAPECPWLNAAFSLYLFQISRSLMPQADCRSVVVINELPMIYFDDLSGFLARNRRHNVATYLTALSYEAIERTFGATATEVLHDQLENFITSSITVESSIRFCHKVRSGYIQPFYITQLKPFAWMGASVPRRRDVQVELPSREYYGFLPAGEETFSSGREM